MAVHYKVIAALVLSLAVFWAGGFMARCLGVDRSPEKSFHYVVPDKYAASDGYVVPMLFPVDLIVMLLMSAALGWAAVVWGPPGFGVTSWWILLALPVAYLVFDFAEDRLLALIISGKAEIAASRGLLSFLTKAKFIAVIAAWVEVALAGACAYWRSRV